MSEPVVVIRCRENGPFVVKGAVKIVDHQDNEFPIPPGKDHVSLCRCVHSKRMPFCDGTHKHVGFQLAETAPAPENAPASENR